MDDWCTPHACASCPWIAIDRDLESTAGHDPSRHFEFGSRGGFVAPLDLPELDSLKVVRAMAIADPNPTLRGDDELAAGLDDGPPYSAPEFRRGVADASRWLVGTNRRAPGSQTKWPRSRPGPEHADAESHMLTGRVYDYDHIDQQSYYGGADCALWWALGRWDELYPSRASSPQADDTPKN
jgi:hypothetical protein